MDATGNLYRTTYFGGSDENSGFGYGTIFELAKDGTEKILHRFDGSDGANPETSLTFQGNDKLVGTASEGGNDNFGTVFTIRH